MTLLDKFLNDPRNTRPIDVSIHNKLSNERKKRLYYLIRGRGNGKPLTQLELYKEIFATRRDDIPVRKLPPQPIDQIVSNAIDMLKKAEHYEKLGSYIHESVGYHPDPEPNKVWITTANPYGFVDYFTNWFIENERGND